VGPNGAGKTNLIEAISFLAPGRGLRRATLEDVAFSEGDGSWAVAADVEGALGLASLGTGIELPASEGAPVTRKCRIDREPVASASAFADHLRVVWLVPAMDGLFNGPASERRRFLDRLVLAVDAEHGSRVNALRRAALAQPPARGGAPDPHWLDAIEHETAELAVAVTALRVETVTRLQAARCPPDPGSGVSGGRDRARRLDGKLCRSIPRSTPRIATGRCSGTTDARCRRRTHPRRAASQRPHRRYAAKNIAAADASTGEQKALLIGLVLAHAGLLAEMSGNAPVLLLDEVVAHRPVAPPRSMLNWKARRAGLADRRRRRGIRGDRSCKS
jgi:DNA replication and repair protein RecF